jgi:mRNA-degrading endonuclease toxin of MazEF toxin-antitoxin module
VKLPEGGLSTLSFVKREDIGSVPKQRLKHFHGRVSPDTLAEVDARIRILLGL